MGTERTDIPKMINDLQDIIRNKLMKEISFENVNNLTETTSSHDIKINLFRKYPVS